MLKPLSKDDRTWVETTLASMTLAEKIGHLLCPEDRSYSLEEWLAILDEVPVGSVFFSLNPLERAAACLEAIQKRSRIPVLVASDLENGAGCMVEGATEFPRPMALAASGSLRHAEAMGKATAREGRAHGVHWTFSPVVDLNINLNNPVTNIRSFGDQPRQVARQTAAVIRGLQAAGQMAATAKHFPGDGMDDRDQHLCTSVNSCSVPRWWKTYGQVWKAAIKAGVMSIMVGHIAFPAYEGLDKTPARALPGTLNPRLQVKLLREELGFDGVIVSDAAPMIGIASRVSAEEQALQNILSGSDVYLFADPRQDFRLLMRAVDEGRLSVERIDQSVVRVLEMKARLGLHRSAAGPALKTAERRRFQADADIAARASIVLQRGNAMTPVQLPSAARLLTVTLTYENGRIEPNRDLPVVDAELRKRGFQVDHWLNPSGDALSAAAGTYAAVFVNFNVHPHSLIGTMRLTGAAAMPLWRAFYASYDLAVFTSFGNPYMLYEQPHLPNLYQAFGDCEASQRAAVQAWLGEMPVLGKMPVKLPGIVDG